MIAKGFFFTDDPKKFDPRFGQNAPLGLGWPNIETWFDDGWQHWTSRIALETAPQKLSVIEVDAQSEQEAIEAVIHGLGNLGGNGEN